MAGGALERGPGHAMSCLIGSLITLQVQVHLSGRSVPRGVESGSVRLCSSLVLLCLLSHHKSLRSQSRRHVGGLSRSLYSLLTWRADSIALGLARGVMAALTATDSELAQGLLC